MHQVIAGSIRRAMCCLRRRLLHVALQASPVQVLLSASALMSLSNLGTSVCRTAQDSSVASLMSRGSQAHLHEVLLCSLL